MVELDEFALAKLAREMAMNIRNYKHVFADFGITENDYYIIEKIDFYRRAKDQFTREWNSALSTNDRIKLISAAYVEASLPTIGRRMLEKAEPLPAVIEAGKFLARNAGLGEITAGNNSERFVITINLGGETETYDKPLAIEPPKKTDKYALPGGDDDLDVDIDEADVVNVPPKPEDVAFAAFTAGDYDGETEQQATLEPTVQFVRTPGKRGRPKGKRVWQLPDSRP